MKTGLNWADSLNYFVQVGNPIKPIWLKCGQLTAKYTGSYSKNHVFKFWLFFSFLRCTFSTGNANDLIFLTSSAYNKRKNETFPTFPRALHTSYPATLFPFLVPNTTRSSKEDLIYFNLFNNYVYENYWLKAYLLEDQHVKFWVGNWYHISLSQFQITHFWLTCTLYLNACKTVICYLC